MSNEHWNLIIKYYPLNVKFNILLSAASNFMRHFPYNTFNVNNTLLVDAVNKKFKKLGILSLIIASQWRNFVFWMATKITIKSDF